MFAGKSRTHKVDHIRRNRRLRRKIDHTGRMVRRVGLRPDPREGQINAITYQKGSERAEYPIEFVG